MLQRSALSLPLPSTLGTTGAGGGSARGLRERPGGPAGSEQRAQARQGTLVRSARTNTFSGSPSSPTVLPGGRGWEVQECRVRTVLLWQGTPLPRGDGGTGLPPDHRKAPVPVTAFRASVSLTLSERRVGLRAGFRYDPLKLGYCFLADLSGGAVGSHSGQWGQLGGPDCGP